MEILYELRAFEDNVSGVEDVSADAILEGAFSVVAFRVELSGHALARRPVTGRTDGLHFVSRPSILHMQSGALWKGLREVQCMESARSATPVRIYGMQMQKKTSLCSSNTQTLLIGTYVTQFYS